MPEIILTIGSNDSGRRLDRVLRKALPELPISVIHRLLRKKCVLVNGKALAADSRIEAGGSIVIKGINSDESCSTLTIRHEEQQKTTEKSALHIDALSIPPILFEGAGIIIVNKPSGMASHGENSLETRICSYLSGKTPPSLSFKPGPLHRLDKESSGIITFSTTIDGARTFSEMLRAGLLKKTYLAILDGVLKTPCRWQDELVYIHRVRKTFIVEQDMKQSFKTAPKKAITTVRPLSVSATHTLAEVSIETGRTHQIRACASFRGYPLSGDEKYGSKNKPPFFLHAYTLELSDNNPFGIKKITAPLSHEFLARLISVGCVAPSNLDSSSKN